MLNKELFQKQRFQLAIYLTIIGMFLLPRVPYFNLYIQYSISFLFWGSAILGLGFKARSLFILAAALFFLAAILTLLKENFISESLANGIYFILLTGTILSIRDFVKNEKNNN